MNDKENTMQKWLQSELKQTRNDPDFVLEGILLEFAEQVAIEMDNQEIDKVELAKRLSGCEPLEHVNKVLNCDRCQSIAGASKIALALGTKLSIKLEIYRTKPDVRVDISMKKSKLDTLTAHVIYSFEKEQWYKGGNKWTYFISNAKIYNTIGKARSAITNMCHITGIDRICKLRLLNDLVIQTCKFKNERSEPPFNIERWAKENEK